MVLWQRLRDAYLWATTEPRVRDELFAAALGSAVPPWLAGPVAPTPAVAAALAAVGGLTSAPGRVHASAVARACLAVSRWASEQGHSLTELNFAEVAALADLADPECAYAAGRAARRRGLYEPGREWFRRAIGLARRRDDAATYALAYLGWGLLEEQSGNSPSARRKLLRAWRAAKRGGVRRLMGMARQAMVPYAVADGDMEAAYRHAVAAAKLYGEDDDDLPRLGSDVGALLSLDGYYSAALPLYRVSLPRLLRPADRIAAIANIGRAAAALGLRQEFEASWTEFQAALGIGLYEHAGASMLEIAEGARTLGQLSRARGFVRAVRQLAAGQGDARTLRQADALEHSIREGAPGDRDRKAPAAVRRFVTRLARRVEAMPLTHPDR